MPIGTVPPPAQHPDEPPLVCVALNVEWIPIVLGALQPLKYPEYWGGTLEENRRARKDFGLLINQFMIEEECGMASNCCLPLYIIQRVNVETGMIEISIDNGSNWQPQPDGIPSKIVEPIPPVTSGVASSACNAATNLALQIDEWKAQVDTDFDTATTLTEFATGVFEAILAAVLLILTGGALEGLAALVIPALGAALTAAWGAGKVAFDAFWSTENEDIIFCAAVCTIGDDGSFTDAQFSAFWNKCNTELPPAPAKMLLMGFLSNVGRQGVNAMAAVGISPEDDCSSCDCDCPEPCTVEWTFFNVTDVVKLSDCHYTMTTTGAGHFAFTSGDCSVGCYYNQNVGFLGGYSSWGVGACSSPNNVPPTTSPIWNFDEDLGTGTVLDLRFSATPFV